MQARDQKPLTSVDLALAILENAASSLEAESILVGEAAGRVAATDVVASASVPHFVRAAMDGYAVIAASTRGASTETPIELAVVGDARPGRTEPSAVGAGEAMRITTGAPIPAGADAVVIVERTEEVRVGGAARVRVTQEVAPGKHVASIGEDVAAGTVVVARGRRLRPQDLGVLASVGVARVSVVRRPRVTLLVTGDELLPPGSMPSGARIVDANSVVVSALARRDGAEAVDVVYVADRPERVRDALLAARGDAVLVSGGSSMGSEDHAPRVLAAIGELTVKGIAMRPARPAGFGFVGPAGGARRPVVLLPGNPVACLCAYEFFAGPTIRALGGLPRAWPHRTIRAPLAAPIASEHGRVDYVRVRIDDGRVTPIATSGASILTSTTRADGAVLVAAERERLEQGEEVEVLLYD